MIVLSFQEGEERIYQRVMAALEETVDTKISYRDYSEPLDFGILQLDPRQRSVTYKGENKDFTLMEYDVLYLLASHAGQVLPAHLVYETVAHEEYTGTWCNVKDIIYRIRKKTSPEIIKTVHRYGYKFILEQK